MLVSGLWNPSSCVFEEDNLSQWTEEENLEPCSVWAVPLLSKTQTPPRYFVILKNFQSPTARGQKARMVWGFLRRRRRAPLVAADISGNYRRHYQNNFLEFIDSHCGTIAVYCKISILRVPGHFFIPDRLMKF